MNQERTNWRDEELSKRHRTWGKEFSAFDLDFIMVEYSYKKPCALVEYKNEHATEQSIKQANHATLKELGDLARLPVFCVRYASDFSWWKVIPMNGWATLHVGNKNERPILTEQEWLSFLRYVKDDVMIRRYKVQK